MDLFTQRATRALASLFTIALLLGSTSASAVWISLAGNDYDDTAYPNLTVGPIGHSQTFDQIAGSGNVDMVGPAVTAHAFRTGPNTWEPVDLHLQNQGGLGVFGGGAADAAAISEDEAVLFEIPTGYLVTGFKLQGLNTINPGPDPEEAFVISASSLPINNVNLPTIIGSILATTNEQTDNGFNVFQGFTYSGGILGLAASTLTGDPLAQFRIVEIELTAVPVPAAVWLFITALGGLGLMRSRGQVA